VLGVSDQGLPAYAVWRACPPMQCGGFRVYPPMQCGGFTRRCSVVGLPALQCGGLARLCSVAGSNVRGQGSGVRTYPPISVADSPSHLLPFASKLLPLPSIFYPLFSFLYPLFSFLRFIRSLFLDPLNPRISFVHI
jgi:hypothetical protein